MGWTLQKLNMTVAAHCHNPLLPQSAPPSYKKARPLSGPGSVRPRTRRRDKIERGAPVYQEMRREAPWHHPNQKWAALHVEGDNRANEYPRRNDPQAGVTAPTPMLSDNPYQIKNPALGPGFRLDTMPVKHPSVRLCRRLL
jgi:hypothetical protein